ncbi:MAG: putative Fe-S protein [Acidobacteria bacterium]|nr:putative Fe-S protein [Acidobacteriota bacterium]
MTEVGRVRAIYRYPVKSMAGEPLSSAQLGWYGLEGDRRLAFIRSGVQAGFPWLTASKLPSLITYVPLRDADDALPSRVRTPKGEELELRGDALRAELTAAHGAPVELMQLDHGIFDDAPLSIITTSAVAAVTGEAGVDADARRFRPNLLIETADGSPFPEDAWIGRTLRIGEGEEAPAVAVCMRDVRCVMINLHPDTAVPDARLLKASVRINENCAGVYATIIKSGSIRVGDMLTLA